MRGKEGGKEGTMRGEAERKKADFSKNNYGRNF